jgi:hypothetical protein
MKTITKLGMMCALMAGSLMPLTASTEAWDFTTLGTSLNNGNGYSLGQIFVPTQSFTLDFLGYYAANGLENFDESHVVSIYDAAGDLLDTTTINNSTSFTTGSGDFAFNPVTPINLIAGNTYVIDGASGTVDKYAFDDSGFTVYAPITIAGQNWILNGGGTADFTGTTPASDLTGDGYWGPNFGWDAGLVTPEPASLLLVGTAFLAAGILLRRKRLA